MATTELKETLIGKTVAEAQSLAKKAGCKVRVMQEDGEHFCGTCDYVPTRLNLSVEGGKVTAVDFG
jgi:Fe-S oxidoreductase